MTKKETKKTAKTRITDKVSKKFAGADKSPKHFHLTCEKCGVVEGQLIRYGRKLTEKHGNAATAAKSRGWSFAHGGWVCPSCSEV